MIARTVFSAVVLVLLAFCSCSGKNIHGPIPQPAPKLSVNIPPNMQGGKETDWNVYAYGGTQPYTIEMDLGGGATDHVEAGTAVSGRTFYKEFLMINPSYTEEITYSVYIQVTDANGLTATFFDQYTVGPMENKAYN